MTHNTRRTRKNSSNSKESERRDTLHDFSIEYVKALAEVFGWRVRAAKGSKKGPDLVIESVTENGVKAVMFVESEVGHDQGGGNITSLSLPRVCNLTWKNTKRRM